MTPSRTSPIKSFSYCAEDIVLRRGFADQPSGFYIDVGANHHESGSVTKIFYDEGWTGINIEPQTDLFDLLTRHRSRDTNVCACCSSSTGTGTLNRIAEENGLSTVDQIAAQQYASAGKTVQSIAVEFRTLDSIIEEHYPNQIIDFVSIDVEGHEADVLAGFDLQRWRPKVLLIEATEPYTTRLVSDMWEPAILAAGYSRTLFDGINLFFVRLDLATLALRLSYPANPLDNYVPSQFASAVKRFEETKSFGAVSMLAARTTQFGVNSVKKIVKRLGIS